MADPTILEAAARAMLILPLKREYFEAIHAGTKLEEYRLVTPFWTKRLVGDDGRPRAFCSVVLTMGYPKAGDTERRIVRQWRGFTRKVITHPHFGANPVEVYAIDVSLAAAPGAKP